MTRQLLWASALVLPFIAAAPAFAQPAAGPPGTATVPAEKMAPPAPTPPASGAAMAPAAAPANLSTADKHFVEKAAEGGMMEVQAAKLAQDKGSDQTVKDFAAKMIADHTANNDKLAALAQQKGLTVPSEIDSKDQAMLTKMQGLSGAKFDKAYLKAQVSGHEKMLKLMQMESKSGKDADLKAFAATTASTVQEHLTLAKQDSSM